MEQSKKYSEMTFEEFITEVLGIELVEHEIHMVKMFEETKSKKIEYINNYGVLPNFKDNGMTYPPKVTFTSDSTNSEIVKKSNGDIRL